MATIFESIRTGDIDAVRSLLMDHGAEESAQAPTE